MRKSIAQCSMIYYEVTNMSKNLIVYAHPYDKSFNHAILEQVQDLL